MEQPGQIGSSTNAAPQARRRGILRRSIFSTDHRVIGMQYLGIALAAIIVGTLLSILMRIHLIYPDAPLPFFGLLRPENYLALVTMHGTLMIFFVLTTAPQSGFGNLVLPAQIGARQMSLPWLNAASVWTTLLSFLILLAALFVPGGGPISGWSSYPPLSAIPSAGPGQALGMDLWILSIAVFCLGSLMGAVNTLTTVIRERCTGMTMMRLPLTVWSWFITALLMLLAFGVLFAAAMLLFSDRHFGTSFFIPTGSYVNGQLLPNSGGTPLLWLHLFWFFGHPEVYIAVLPGMGLASTLLANFSRRRIPSYAAMVYSTIAIGLLGFVVWGHHMFVSGMNPFAGSAFALTTMAIAIPSTVKVFSWLANIRRGALWLTPPMLFTLGFVSFFLCGGLTGPILAQPVLDEYLHNTYFVVAHFHLIMAMAGVFSLFAATYYWFPLIRGRQMHSGLGKWHFWLTLILAYATFFPMHFAGLAGEPRHYAQLTGTAAYLATLLPLQRFITLAALLLGATQVLFLVNLLWSWSRGPLAPENPWRSTTLEWQFFRPSEASPIVHCGPCEYGVEDHVRQNESDFRPQWEAAPKQE